MLLLQIRRRKPLCVVSVQLCISYILNQINYIFEEEHSGGNCWRSLTKLNAVTEYSDNQKWKWMMCKI